MKNRAYFVKDSKSEYSVLIPSVPTQSECFAACEFTLFFERATGIKLPVVTEGVYIVGEKYFSIGDTELFRNSGIKLPSGKLSADGCKVVTVGRNVFMNAPGESGKIYAVYEFMSAAFNFCVYAQDEIYIEKKTELAFFPINLTSIPSFSGRDVHNYVLFNDSLFATRLRLNGVRTSFTEEQGSGSAWSKKLWAHTTFMILPPDVYKEEHPLWYSDDGTQLCFAKALDKTQEGRAMFSQFVYNLKRFIEAEPSARYFMIGQEDIGTTCKRDISVAANRRYGGENENCSGTLVVFVNKVARSIRQWLKKEYPARAETVKLVIFAYQKTLLPPVTFCPETNSYRFVKEVVPEKNVVVRFAPLSNAYSRDFLDEQMNPSARMALLGWSALGARISVWNYDIGFGAYEFPMYNLHVLQSNYRIFRKFGVEDLLVQGARDTGATPLWALRNFLHARLLWNAEADVQTLIEDFCAHYFGNRAKQMTEYIDFVNAHYKIIEVTKDYVAYAGAWESRDSAIPKFYPKEFLIAALDLFKKMYDGLHPVKDEKIIRRIKAEELSPRFMLLFLYRQDYSLHERREMIESFARDARELGLLHYREDKQDPAQFLYSIDQVTAQWLDETALSSK